MLWKREKNEAHLGRYGKERKKEQKEMKIITGISGETLGKDMKAVMALVTQVAISAKPA